MSTVAAKGINLLTLVLHRSFTRTAFGQRTMQDSPTSRPQRNWVNTSALAIGLLGLSLSVFSTKQLYQDPNSQCLLWKK